MLTFKGAVKSLSLQLPSSIKEGRDQHFNRSCDPSGPPYFNFDPRILVLNNRHPLKKPHLYVNFVFRDEFISKDIYNTFINKTEDAQRHNQQDHLFYLCYSFVTG